MFRAFLFSTWTILVAYVFWRVSSVPAVTRLIRRRGLFATGGQIWPFRYLVRLTTPYVEGRYQVGPMTLLVSRGTGSWGPRMRLFLPAEILRITLRAA